MKIFAIALLKPQEKDVEAQTQESWKGLQSVKKHNNKHNITAVQKPGLENRAQQDTLGYTSIAVDLQCNPRVNPPLFPVPLSSFPPLLSLQAANI